MARPGFSCLETAAGARARAQQERLIAQTWTDQPSIRRACFGFLPDYAVAPLAARHTHIATLYSKAYDRACCASGGDLLRMQNSGWIRMHNQIPAGRSHNRARGEVFVTNLHGVAS